ncbi:acyl-CoA dehydrogenase [Hydrogenophaga intermedia]|uniref:acyl-CoA dehydrogenase n=1 Tax=Hydrogenophaga intermedia TaxID=65786 RepID=UPI002044020E|nr:acyl-CoA dehydrogenase [Hydrogenophaga intermedia]MCM3562729.1 acyl-CoA dehydrogenase [Hydrogenophaga intermedia]
MIDLVRKLDDLSDEQRMLRDAGADFFAGEAEGRRLREWRGRSPGYDLARWREMAGLGWLGLCTPERYGGSGCGLAQAVQLLEQCGRALAPEPLVGGALLPAWLLLGGGNEALRACWLPAMARGEKTLGVAWQEGEHDQTARAEHVRATPHGGGFILDGTKRFVAAAGAAAGYIVSAQAPQGPVLVLVESGRPGLALGERPRVDGGFWGELQFEEVAVAAEQILAGPVEADAVLQRALDLARIATAAELLGVMGRALDSSVQYIAVREQFGRPVGSFQALQHRAVDLLIQVELTRAVVARSAEAADGAAGDLRRLALAASQAKARASAAALAVTKGCIQLHGGIGYTDECAIGLYLKKAMVGAAWLGGAGWHRRRYNDMGPISGGGETAPGAIGGGRPSISHEELRRWIVDNFPPQWRFPPNRLSLRETREWHARLHGRGWAAPNWPTEHGGMGLSAFEQVALQSEFDRHGIHIAPNMGIVMLGPLIIRYGTEAQKREILPRILSGQVLWCQGYSEPSAGSDLASLRTSAVADGDDFIVSGQKIWTSFAHEADMIFLLVRTDPRARKQDGISFLLADMRSPGITVKRIRNLGGGAEFCEVFFDNVRVPRSNLVGALNQGWTMAKSLLGSERIMIGNPRGVRAPLLQLRELARASGLEQDAAWRARHDELQLDVDDLDALFVRCADVLRRGLELGPEVSMLKIWATEAQQRVADLMLETAGESGVADASLALPGGALHPANVFFSARPATIYGGSNEIQRNILAKGVLELPG